MKCANDENKGNNCSFQTCPRSGYEGDWKDLTDPNRDAILCPFRRSDKWQPKTVANDETNRNNSTREQK